MTTVRGLFISLCFWQWRVLLIDCYRINALRRQKRETCLNETYITDSGWKCCMCPAGYHLKNDCKKDFDQPECEPCYHNTYLDHASSERNCEPCTVCDTKANMKPLRKCLTTQNTVCICMEGFYCDKENCKACYPCDICPSSEVKTPCNQTSNTVCKETSNKQHIAVWISLIMLLVAVVILVYLCKRRKKKAAIVRGLPDPPQDLSLKLDGIAGALGLKLVRRLCRQSLTEPQMDNIELEHHSADDKAYYLLVDWHQKEGRNSYSKLITFLNDTKNKHATDRVNKVLHNE